MFAVAKSETKVLDRGLEFPKNIRVTARIVQEDRVRAEPY